MAGCQSWPDSYLAGVDQITTDAKVRNARAQRIEHMPGLRVDSAAQCYLDAALSTDELEPARDYANVFLLQASALAQSTASSELLCLNEQSIGQLNQHYFPSDAPLTRDQLVARYMSESSLVLNEMKQKIEAAPDPSALQRQLRNIADNMEQPVKYRGKTARILTWLPFYLPSKMVADHVQKTGPGCPLFLGSFDAADVYEPVNMTNPPLERFAPILVVEQNPDARYEPQVDRIGHVVAEEVDRIAVRPDQPAIYGYSRQILLHGQEREQLVYAAWFARHPQLTANDPMAGHIDGLTIRVTLDHENRPAIVETIANCGCFHGLYPSRAVEDAAGAQYGTAEEGMRYVLERDAGRKLNAHIPNLLEGAGSRPVIYVAAGWHSIVHVSLDPPVKGVASSATYTLRPYDELERLTTPDGRYTSMFYDNGLVRHAQRPEGVYFTPLGMLSAGQPRQRETQLIYWDQYDFDDPALLTRLLRLPDDF